MPNRRSGRTELVMPAGSLGKLKCALLYGADAVYAGTPELSLRSKSDFSLEDLAEGARFAHALGKRLYLTLNLFAHNKDVERLPLILDSVRQIAPDGLIVADPGVFQYFREQAPELELHISTQANVTSFLGVKFWQRQGASLCVLAREVSFGDLAQIRAECPDMRLETFVHGAMCMTYSGRCLLSNYLAERGANQGSCAHSCRWRYNLKVRTPDGGEAEVEINDTNVSQFQFFLEEEFRRGELYAIEEDERGTYILNSRDLCLMPRLDQYLALGVDSLKVEGRNKSEYYAAVVARAYRLAIDAYYRDPESFDASRYMHELETVKSRGYTLGFHEGRLTNLAHDYAGGQSYSPWEFAGLVKAWQGDELVLEVKNRLSAGDVLEFLVPGALNEDVRLRCYEYVSASDGQPLVKISGGEGRAIRLSLEQFHAEDAGRLPSLLPAGCVVRKSVPLPAEQSLQLEHNQLSFAAEQGLIRADRLRAPRAGRSVSKAPRVGAEGCCGLGCNGCLPFWNEAKYAKAREQLVLARHGRRLTKAEALSDIGTRTTLAATADDDGGAADLRRDAKREFTEDAAAALGPAQAEHQ
ncbi:MAG TPA: U32 family peptidase [Polyangiaceae bacterium]|nr:U32 family peptidase [Polyangiaceae bacterium]